MLADWLKPHWESYFEQKQNDHLPHAFLLSGPVGIGKRTLAQSMLSAALCRDADVEQPACGVCQNCRLLEAGSHPDQLQLRPEADANQIKVDQIRELCRKATLTSSISQYQVFLIDPADQMNSNAANALLKTLEEPRAGTLIILIAESKNRLPITIMSRCRQVDIAIPDKQQSLQWIKQHTDAQQEQVDLAMAAAGGSPGQALSFLQNADVIEDYKQTLREIKQLCHGRADPVALAKRWADEHVKRRLSWLGHSLRQECWSRQGVACKAYGLTGQVETDSLMHLCRQADSIRSLTRSTLKPELMLERMFIDWQHGDQNL